MLAPPPELSYTSLEAAQEALHNHELVHAQGYAVSIQRTRKVGIKATGLIKHQSFHCVMGGKHVLQEQKKRQTSTSKTDCHFQVTIFRKEVSGAETWHVEVNESEHNHPSFDSSAHVQWLHQSESLCWPWAKLESNLAGSWHPCVNKTPIAWLRRKTSTIFGMQKGLSCWMGGHLWQLCWTLALSDTVHDVERDAEQNLTHLFILPSTSKQICEYSSCKIWLLDATYKTNQFDMSLLDCVGVTSTYQTFTLFHCFLRRETTSDYTWAISKLLDAFSGFGLGNNHVFVTDRELTLMTAISTTFPSTCSNVLYL